jgi:hypothetical protein
MLELLLAHVQLAALGDVRLDVARTCQQAPRLGRLAIVASAGSAAAGAAPRRGAGAAPLRACVATARARLASLLRATTFLTGDRLAAFLPLADFGAGLLAGINDSYRQISPLKNARLYRPTPVCTGYSAALSRPHLTMRVYPRILWCAAANLRP